MAPGKKAAVAVTQSALEVSDGQLVAVISAAIQQHRASR
jgi:Na+-transporting methylmalonyl-CoA/oxaloacetate decarboxylase gamma subunit